MAVMNIEQVSADMPLSPLYIIHGEEDLLRIEALDTLRAAAKKQGYLNREVFTADNGADWDELLQSAGSAGLFADLKLLEIHIPNGKPGKTGGDALQTFAERLPEDTVTLILLPKLEKAQTQAKWFTALAAKGTVLEAKAISAQALFAERVEGNLLAARQEIDKLALLHPQNHTVNIADAEAAVANVARFDVFQLSSAWMKGDALRVARLLDGLEEEGEEPVLLLWAVAEDIRTLIRRAQTRTKRTIRPQQPATVGRQTNPRADCRQTHSRRPPDRSAQNLRQNRPHHQRRGRRRRVDGVQAVGNGAGGVISFLMDRRFSRQGRACSKSVKVCMPHRFCTRPKRQKYCKIPLNIKL